MVIHRRTPHNIPTVPYMVSGYVWQRWPRWRITSTFVAVSPLHGHLIDTPYVNIERKFFLPRASPPEVYDTLVQVSCYKLLVTGYLNGSLGPNPNLQRDFPLIPWKGEIAVLFIGKRKPYVSRAPPQSKFGIYMEVCIAHVEVGSPFPSYIKSIWPGHGVSGRGVSAFANIVCNYSRCTTMEIMRVQLKGQQPAKALLDQEGWTIKTLDRVLQKWVSMIPEFLSSDDDECASVQLGSSDMAPSATKTILRQRFPMRRYHVGSDGRLSNSPKVMDYTTDMITQSVAAFLQPHTSSLSVSVVSHVMASLMGGDFGTEEFNQVLGTQLDALAISPQAKQDIIPALLGIAKLAKVQSQSRSQCASTSTSFSQPMVSEPEPELMDSNAEASYQIRQRPFSSNSGSGYTTWYLGRSCCSVLMPPTVPQAKTGHLYVHHDTSRDTFIYWILTTANHWERVSSGAEHPLNHDRVLAIRANGEPSWVTRASTVTTKTRKEKEIREKCPSVLVSEPLLDLFSKSLTSRSDNNTHLVSQVLKSQEPPVLYEVSSAPLVPRLPHASPAPAAWPCVYFDFALTLVTQSDLVSTPLNGSATITTRMHKVRNKAEDLGSGQNGIPNAASAVHAAHWTPRFRSWGSVLVLAAHEDASKRKLRTHSTLTTTHDSALSLYPTNIVGITSNTFKCTQAWTRQGLLK
ncbi:hypothetical protein EDB92DRAFT_1824093 [Lactarius akahatsu]|uniref:Uncharacterized protein n=1 Tax=Lactarius akahatsu TaxID=416441 RepID=A0AAD4L562_9AGAM|nr:hypothetical protein EDB92DRAFT_1824093 [Lactarius akahatsu]